MTERATKQLSPGSPPRSTREESPAVSTPSSSAAGSASGASGPTDLALSDAVLRMYHTVDGLTLPQPPDGAAMRTQRQRALRLMESYALPRISEPKAPLVVVIGGPTGAGKSTLTNSLVGAPVSLSGVMRPTTREPVMIYNRADAQPLGALGLLPGDDNGVSRPDAARWVRARAVPHDDVVPGLAIIDSPDLDSRVDSNRQLAEQLLTVADLWLFVTTGTDYADAMSWTLLNEAARRQVSVAVVLNRLRERESSTVRNHFATLLRDAGLAHAYVFTLPEVRLLDGRLPVHYLLGMQRWLEKQARRPEEREVHTARAFDGTVGQAASAVRALADAADDHVVSIRRLRVDFESVFSRAREGVRTRCTDGSLVTDELVEAWAPLLTDPETASASRFRRRRSRRSSDPNHAIGEALGSAITALMREQVDQALFRVAERWRGHPAVSSAPIEEVAKLPADFDARVDTAYREWLRSLAQRAREAAGSSSGPPMPEHSDPVVVTLATLALQARPGHSPAPAARASRVARRSNAEREAAREKLRAEAVRRLAGLNGSLDADRLSRDGWLDLIAALTRVVNQDEARLAALADTSHLTQETAGMLRSLADQVDQAKAARSGDSGNHASTS
jgi:energy-coupling factor transporter ATP-binding protein EcfA2